MRWRAVEADAGQAESELRGQWLARRGMDAAADVKAGPRTAQGTADGMTRAARGQHAGSSRADWGRGTKEEDKARGKKGVRE
jgi:hypothetical protein